MRKSEVVIDRVYLVKVNGKLARVQVTNELSIGKGWSGLNLATGRRINIRSSQRLRKVAD